MTWAVPKWTIGLGIGALLLLTTWMSGCSLMTPPASVRYLQSLSKGGLQQANPQNVRVAVNLPEGVTVTHLAADIKGQVEGDKVETKLLFHIVPASEALASPPTARYSSGNWTYYALTKDSVKNFKKVQAFASRHMAGNEPKTITVHVHNKLSMTDCGLKGKVPLVAAILLNPKRGYVVAWDEMDSLSHIASAKNRICAPESDQ